MAEFIELFVDQGANFAAELHLTDITSNTAMNIAGLTFVGSTKRSIYSPNTSGNFVFTYANTANGYIIYSLPWDVTANMKWGTHFGDISYYNSGNTVKTRIIDCIVQVNSKFTP